MKKLALLLNVLGVSVCVAVTYYVFEYVVAESQHIIWYEWFKTDQNRFLVVPIIIVLSLVFFGLVHFLDKGKETEAHALGNVPKATVTNYAKVLVIGYFSLVAGATLGPEAVLVPASMIIGAYIGTKFFRNDKPSSQALVGAAIVALFTAFFHSAPIGMLSVFLLKKQAKTKLSIEIIALAAVSSVTSFYTLRLLSAESYMNLPTYSWRLSVSTVAVAVVLLFAGWLVIHVMKLLHDVFLEVKKLSVIKSWVFHALVAASVLAVLYLVGGSLVEFTGNKSIVPMLNQASALGLVGLLWILFVKISAMSWSRAVGYRGGMIFPTVFLAAVLVAIAQLYVPDFNFIFGMSAAMVGAFIANNTTRILV